MERTKTCSTCRRDLPQSDFSNPGAHNCRPCAVDVSRRWRERNPDRARYQARKSTLKVYGITPEEYDQLLEEQGGVCAACGRPEWRLHQSGRTRSLAVDHCHETGVIRGLLCNRCNISFGQFEDDPEELVKLLRYALKHNPAKAAAITGGFTLEL